MFDAKQPAKVTLLIFKLFSYTGVAYPTISRYVYANFKSSIFMSLEMIVFTVNEHENILFVGQASGYAIDYKKHVSL